MPTEQEKQLAKEIKRVYEQAAKETQKKLADFIKGHRVRNQKMLQYVRDGVLSESDYQHWLKGQVFQEKQWKEKVKDVTQIYLDADKKAHDLVNGTAEDVFVDVANHTAYDIEKDFKGGVSFNIYDERTVERLLRDDPQVLPKWKINEPKDYIWNQKRVQNSVLQGIIQGESIAEIGQRLTTELATSNEKKMRLFARTAMTGAQNAGRIQRLRETESMGIEVRKKWLATLDSRTRDAHRDLDGQERKVNENFESDDGEIAYPGDPTAPARLVYNCRCTLTYVYPQYQHLQQNHQRYDQENKELIQYKTYRQWKRWKNGELEQQKKNKYTVKTIEYSEWFPKEAQDITRNTIQQLEDEFPLTFDLDYVGDVRTHRNIGLDDEIFDLYHNNPQLVPCSAQYLPNGVGDGKPCIEIHNENAGIGSLKNEFKERYELRKREGIGPFAIPDRSHAFYYTSGNLEGIIMHEYGHALSDSYGVFSGGNENPFRKWQLEFWEQHKEELLSISLYAASQPDEMFAEAFVQYHDKEHQDTLAYKLASEIIETFIKYSKDGVI